MRQKKRKTMEKETRHQRRHDSLHCPRVKCNFDRLSGKTKQITNWSVSSFKGKLKFSRFKIVKYEIRAFKRKIEIKQFLFCLSRLPQTITSDVDVRISRRILCTIPPAML